MDTMSLITALSVMSMMDEIEMNGRDFSGESYDASSQTIEQLIKQRDEARLLVAEANNSLYGSQGYFHSMNGGEFDKYHLARGIEDLKQRLRALSRQVKDK